MNFENLGFEIVIEPYFLKLFQQHGLYSIVCKLAEW